MSTTSVTFPTLPATAEGTPSTELVPAGSYLGEGLLPVPEKRLELIEVQELLEHLILLPNGVPPSLSIPNIKEQWRKSIRVYTQASLPQIITNYTVQQSKRAKLFKTIFLG